MRKIAFLGISLLMASVIFAQKLTGTIRDDKGKGLNGATVTLLRAADSSTVKFTGTKNDGSFAFTAITDGEYILNATHVGYKPLYTGKITVAGDTPLGDLALST